MQTRTTTDFDMLPGEKITVELTKDGVLLIGRPAEGLVRVHTGSTFHIGRWGGEKPIDD
jgi:hypothetical protein